MDEDFGAKFDKLWRELGLHLGYKNDKGEKIKQFIVEVLAARDRQWEVAVKYNLSFNETSWKRVKTALEALQSPTT